MDSRRKGLGRVKRRHTGAELHNQVIVILLNEFYEPEYEIRAGGPAALPWHDDWQFA